MAGRGRAEVRAVTGGAQEEGAKEEGEEEEGVRIAGNKTLSPWVPVGDTTPPLPSCEEGKKEENGRGSSHEPQGHLSSENHNSWWRVMMFDGVESHA